MKEEYLISENDLAKTRSFQRIKYQSLFNTLRGNGEISDLLTNAGAMFTTIFNTVESKLSNESFSLNGTRDNFLFLYSGYLSSEYVSKELDSQLDNGGEMDFEFVERTQKPIIPTPGETDYATIKKSLEEMISTSLKSTNPIQGLKDYFIEYSNQMNEDLIRSFPSSLISQINKTKWTIGNHTINGLRKQKVQRNEKPTNIKNRGLNKRKYKEDIGAVEEFEKDKFYIELPEIVIDSNTVISRERIVGDTDKLVYLERMVRSVFLYNEQFDRNAALEKGLFKSAAILSGPEGSGKGTVGQYINYYAKKIAQELGKEIYTTYFTINSAWKDGSIQKLQSQINQITNSKKRFLIIQEEMDSEMKDKSSSGQKNEDLKVLNEFNKFFEGKYQNKGNYFFLGDINDIDNLRKSNRSRFKVLNWRGAHTPEQKSQLFNYKLEGGINIGYVSVSNSDFKKLGELAYELGLTGRDITTICNKVKSDSFEWTNLSKIYDLENNYDSQLKMIDSMMGKIDYGVLKNETVSFSENLVNAKKDASYFRQK